MFGRLVQHLTSKQVLPSYSHQTHIAMGARLEVKSRCAVFKSLDMTTELQVSKVSSYKNLFTKTFST